MFCKICMNIFFADCVCHSARHRVNPALSEGYVRLLYPDKPRHPRQKYLLTVKDMAIYREIGK